MQRRRGAHHLGKISIHAPREGSDYKNLGGIDMLTEFLSTLPARGATCAAPCLIMRSYQFLSTLPARGATCSHSKRHGRQPFLSTLPARGATAFHQGLAVHAIISIHAPREGSDTVFQRIAGNNGNISIHAPREGSDQEGAGRTSPAKGISIHAPREGSDQELRRHLHRPDLYFYPRSPRGERPFPLGVLGPG